MAEIYKKRSINKRRIEILLTDLIILIVEWIIYFNYPNSRLSLIAAFILLVINTSRIWFQKQVEECSRFIIKYRYPIALALFILLVSLRVHGSSIGIYDILYGKYDESITSELFGQSRLIRSDEWNVQVPYFFSQFYNGFKLESDFMAISPQNMIIGYNAPVIDLTLIGKPFIWGYILFGNSVGLSWYWCSKILLYLLVSFEMFRILLRNDYLSVFASITLVFSPTLQWWLAPHMYQVFFWASALFIAGYYFFTAEGLLRKGLFTLLSICCMTGFVIAIFPSLQISLGLLMLFLLLGQLYKDKDRICRGKALAFQLGTVVIVLSIIIGIFYLESSEAIKLLGNTVYPGHRISIGGNFSFNVLFPNPSVALTPFKNPELLNASEISTFNQLGFACILTFPYLWLLKRRYYTKEKFVVGYILLGALFVECFFMLVGFPEPIAIITLFSYINRMDMVYGFTAFLFTYWTIDRILRYRKHISWKTGILISGIYTLCFLYAVGYYIDPGFERLVGQGFYYCVVLLFGFTVFLLFTKWRRLFFSLTAGWTVLTGMLVNPIVTGADSISNHSIVIEGKKLAEKDPDGLWVATNSTFTQQLLLANGLKVINGVNFYPDIEKWKIIDPDSKYQDIYNRYAHINIQLTDGDTSLSLNTPDSLTVELNPSKLKELGIQYLVGGKEEADLLGRNGIQTDVKFEDQQSNQFIYELIY